MANNRDNFILITAFLKLLISKHIDKWIHL